MESACDPVDGQAPNTDSSSVSLKTHTPLTSKTLNDDDNGQNNKLVSRSLGFVSLSNPLRQLCLAICRSKHFDRMILCAIVLNSLTMALTDFSVVDPDTGLPDASGSWRNALVEWLEIPFTLIFATECSIKILAHGFIHGPHTYLRDSWNCLDGIIVISRYVTSL